MRSFEDYYYVHVLLLNIYLGKTEKARGSKLIFTYFAIIENNIKLYLFA